MENDTKRVKHFLSVLGTGDYHKANYSLCDDDNRIANQTHNSEYIQTSVFALLCKDYSDGDKITIFVTEESKRIHGLKLKNELEELIGDKKTDLNFIMIKNGMSKSEQWENFNLMYNEIGCDEEVTADVTHGFRTLPIQLYTILGYAETLKNITVKGVYYGAFEQTFAFTKENEYISPEIYSRLKKEKTDLKNNISKLEKNDPENKLEALNEILNEKTNYFNSLDSYTPIIDYSEYLKILDLNRAAFVFEKTGNAGVLFETADRSFSEHKKEREYQELKNYYHYIETISENIRFVRGNSSVNKNKGKERSIFQALKYWKNKKANLEKSDNTLSEYKAILNISNHMDEIIEKYFNNVLENDNSEDIDLKTGIAVIKWCIDYDYIQAGYTALEETVKTWMCYIAGKEIIEDIKTRICNIDKPENNTECGVYDYNIREQFGRMATAKNKSKDTDEDMNNHENNVLEEICNDFIQMHTEYSINEILKLLQRIKEARNDLNHFGFSKSSEVSGALRTKLINDYNQFLELINLN